MSKLLKIIEELDSIYSPSGKEVGVYLSKFFKAKKIKNQIDEKGNFIASLEGKKGLKVLIDAHIDEVVINKNYPFKVEGDIIYGKSFDNRLGVASAISTLMKLPKLNYELVFAGTVGEETGQAGARYINDTKQSDLVIVVDTAPMEVPKWDPMYKDHHVIISAHENPTEYETILISTAKKLNLPYQIVYDKEKNVTNGKAYSNSQVIVVEIPIHFMHNKNWCEDPSKRHPEFTDEMMEKSRSILEEYCNGKDIPEVASLKDVQNTVKLLSIYLQDLHFMEEGLLLKNL